jgi:hypothetical protein
MTISIKPTASGSTIEQDGSAILSIDGSGNLTVPNNLSVTGTAPIPDALSTASGSAPSYSARAWVNFNGTGTVAIRASGNVTSITDGGIGIYTVNFTNAMPDVNYVTLLTGTPPTDNLGVVCSKNAGTYSTSAVQIRSGTPGVAFEDFSIISVSILR